MNMIQMLVVNEVIVFLANMILFNASHYKLYANKNFIVFRVLMLVFSYLVFMIPYVFYILTTVYVVHCAVVYMYKIKNLKIYHNAQYGYNLSADMVCDGRMYKYAHQCVTTLVTIAINAVQK